MRSSLDRLIANPSFRSCSPASTSVSPSGIVRMLWTWTCSVKQVDDVAQLFLGVDIVGPDGLESDKVDDRGELVLDAMI